MESSGAGLSLYVGSLEGAGNSTQQREAEEDEEEEEAEAEKQRQNEMHGMLANAFDDLDESDLQQSSYYCSQSAIGNQLDHHDGGFGGNDGVPCNNVAPGYKDGGAGVDNGNFIVDHDAVAATKQPVDSRDQCVLPSRNVDGLADGNLNTAGRNNWENERRDSNLFQEKRDQLHRNHVNNFQEPARYLHGDQRFEQQNCDAPSDAYKKDYILKNCNGLENSHARNKTFENDNVNDVANVSGRSITPWSERSNSLVNYTQLPEDDLNPTGVRLNLDCDESSFYGLPESKTVNDYQKIPSEQQRVVYNDGTDNAGPSVSELQQEFMTADTPHDQLKLLYDARGRELDRLSAEIEQLRADKLQRNSAVQHELTLLKAEKERLEVSRTQSRILLTEKENQIRNLKADHQETSTMLTSANTDITKMKVKLEASDSLIKTLEQNISDLQSADILAKSSQMHEDFLSKLQNSHQDELSTLRNKFSNAQHMYQEEQHKVTQMQQELQLCREKHLCVLLEKNKVISELKAGLEALQQQCDALLSTNSGATLQELTDKVDELTEDNRSLHKQLKVAETKLLERKEDLECYDTALKLGALDSIISKDDSVEQLKLRGPKQLTYDDTLPNVGLQPSPPSNIEVIRKLQEELRRALNVIKHKRDQLDDANAELSKQTTENRRLKAQLKSILVDVKEHQANIKQLNDEKNDFETYLSRIRANSLESLEQNTLLKQQITSTLKQLAAVQHAGDTLISLLDRFDRNATDVNSAKTVEDLVAAVNKHTAALHESNNLEHSLLSRLKEDNMKLIKEKHLWVDRIGSFIASVASLKLKVQDISFSVADDYKAYVSSLKELLEEIKTYASKIKLEQSAFFEKYSSSQNDIYSLGLTLQSLQNKDEDKSRQIDQLTRKLTEERQNRQELAAASVESCKNSYINFHEEAVARVKREYSLVKQELETKVNELELKLTEVKASYVGVCKEKTELEMRTAESRESDVSNEHVRLAINTITNKYEEQLKELKRDHAQELQYLSERKDAQCQVVQPNSCSTTEHSVSSSSAAANFGPQSEHNNDLRDMVNDLKDQIGSIENYKKKIEKLTQDKIELYNSYEIKTKALLEKHESLMESNKITLSEALELQQKQLNEEMHVKTEDNRQLVKQIIALHKQMETMYSDNEKVVAKLSDEVQNLDSDLKEAIHSKIIDQLRFNQDVERMKMDKLQVNEETSKLKRELENVKSEAAKRRSELKDKYRRLENHLDRVKVSCGKRAEHYLSEARRVHKQGLNNRQALLNIFDQKVGQVRKLLSSDIGLVVEKIQLYDHDQQEVVKTLHAMKNTINKLKEYTQTTLEKQESLEHLDEEPVKE
uniref:Centrosomal protein of 152 kDa-like n=2 Tax=Hirondellea gigas TaxID=1518452 RepID=A0A6A7FT56_9CRUS